MQGIFIPVAYAKADGQTTGQCPRHLDFLERHSDKIEAAGPLSDTARLGRDGMWIVEADAEEDVDRLVQEDPFWPTGLRKSYAIIKWTQVYAAGSRLIAPS
ncbi:YciI family protein [Leisingera aquimarina]|uniref:YciI family protein n=1 Tax=Leisingera aquimarina TaxID=476529 RepID=UPI00146FBED5|nr:YciI family protein [Leisingera aquimarina]